jgi:RNA polymerase sigma-70 factor, ECF subfamily
MHTHDDILFERWRRDGDAEAFKTLCDKYAGIVYGASLRILRNSADAQDVAQECFEKLATVKRGPHTSMAAWLHVIATNRALSKLRSEGRRRDREALYQRNRRDKKEPDWGDLYDFVDEAIAKLPEKPRRALVGHFLEGKTHEAIAKEEQVSRAAITLRVARGLEGVRKSLKRKGIIASVTLLGGLLATHLKAEAAPAEFAATLGKLAVSGAGTGGSVGTLGGGPWLLGMVGVLAMGIVATGFFLRRSGEEQAPIPPHTAITDIAASIPRDATDTETPPIRTVSDLPQKNVHETDEEAVQEGIPQLAGAIIRGRVVDLRGNGVGNTQVDVSCEKGATQSSADVTDDDGYFELRDVGPAKIGYLLAKSRNPERLSDVFGLPNLDTGQVREVTLTLHEGQIFGKVVDTQNRPIPDLPVMASPEARFWWGLPVVKTKQDGTFQFEGLFPGNYDLKIEEFPGLWIDTERRVAVADQREVRDVVLTLPDPDGLLIAGRVVDENGWGIEGARVQANQWETPYHSAHSFTDAEGSYYIDRLKTGKYRVYVAHLKYASSGSSIKKAGDESANFTLLPHGAIEGIVLNARTMQPVSPFQVRENVPFSDVNPQSRQERWRDWENPRGHFEITGLDAGEITIPVRAEGYASVEVKADVVCGQVTTGLRVLLEPARTIHGTVLDGKGKPVGGALLFLGSLPQEYEFSQRTATRSAADGSFTLDTCPPAAFRLTVFHHEAGIGSKEVGEEDSDVTLRFAATGNFALRTTRNGAPLDSARISVLMRGLADRPIGHLSSVQDATGTAFQVWMGPAGEGMLSVRMDVEDQHARTTRTMYRAITVTEVPEEEEMFAQALHFAFDDFDTQLEVLVTENDAPRPGLFFSLQEGDERESATWNGHTDEEGLIRVDGMPPGAYRLRVYLIKTEALPEFLEMPIELREGQLFTDALAY